jgi:hypothetical protein
MQYGLTLLSLSLFFAITKIKAYEVCLKGTYTLLFVIAEVSVHSHCASQGQGVNQCFCLQPLISDC